MELIFKNDLLTEDEKKVISRTVDEKIVDLLVLLSKKADGVFFGEQKYQSYINKIMALSDEVERIDILINELDSKTITDLMNIAREYELEVNNTTQKEALIQELKVALNIKKISLNTDKANLYKASDRNYYNTYEHTINSIVEDLNDEQYRELNVTRKSSLKALTDELGVIQDKLKEVHKWFDAVSIPATLLNDYLEELEKTDKLIKDNQEKYALIPDTSDPNSKVSEMSTVLGNINYYRNKKQMLLKSIATQKENILSVYKPVIDFIDLKATIYNKLRFVKANIEDAMIDTRLTDIEKYMVAFNEFFYELVSKQFELENYLDDNEVRISFEKKRDLNQDLVKGNHDLVQYAGFTNDGVQVYSESSNKEDVKSSMIEAVTDYVNRNSTTLPDDSLKPDEKSEEEKTNEPVSQEISNESDVNEQPSTDVSEETKTAGAEEQTSDINYSGIDVVAAGVEPQVDTVWEPTDQVDSEKEISETNVASTEEDTSETITESEMVPVETTPELTQMPGTVYSVSEVKDTNPDTLASAKAKAKDIASITLGGEGRVK